MTARKCVLLVDDDAGERDRITKALEGDYDITAAAHGGIATELLSHGLLPDLVIADVALPYVDGLTLARMMKKDPQLASIPLILIGEASGPSAVIRGIQAGAKHYLEKPLVLANLVDRVKHILK
jgi:CheY-like chemotaxis protein